MATCVASVPPRASIRCAAGFPGDFLIVATRAVSPDDAVILARSEHRGDRATAERRARQLLRAMVTKHGPLGVGVQIIDAETSTPVAFAAWDVLNPNPQ